MENHQKKAIVGLAGGMGVIVFLLGLFTDLYSFMVGLIAALGVWIFTGFLGTFLGVKKEKKN